MIIQFCLKLDKFCCIGAYELTEKAKEIYSKNKAAEYYLQNKESIKKTSKIKTKTCHIQKITRLKSTKEKDISY